MSLTVETELYDDIMTVLEIEFQDTRDDPAGESESLCDILHERLHPVYHNAPKLLDALNYAFDFIPDSEVGKAEVYKLLEDSRINDMSGPSCITEGKRQ